VKDFRPRTHCRLCEHATKVVLDFGETPLANELVSREFVESGEKQDTFPLSVSVCTECGHAQLSGVVSPERMFGVDYPYRSGTSPVFRAHLEEYASEIVERFGVPSKMLEIGSNDGTFLALFHQRHCKVMGVDPAKRAAEDAWPATIVQPFTANLARKILASWGQADLVVANHVLAHIDDLRDVVHGVLELLTEEGVFVFEVGYLADVAEKGLFDVVYHEHVSYHHLGPLIGFFDRLGMNLFDAKRVDTQGGALRCFVKRGNGVRISDRAGRLLDREFDLHLWSPATVADTVARLNPDVLRSELSNLLEKLKSENARVSGFGCPAKAVTLMHAVGFGAGTLDFIVDENPAKQGKFAPSVPWIAGSLRVGEGHIEILPPEALGRNPDFVLILAWNFAEDIMRRYPGHRWIVPLPKVEVVDRRGSHG